MGNQQPHIVVLGAGFGGLVFCQHFKHPDARITIVDRQNHHLFQPLLYQVATAGLSAPEIAQPIRAILTEIQNLTVLMDEVLEVRLSEKLVRLGNGVLHYDYLVLALGSVTSYFGHPEWEEFAPGLKSIDDALRIRRDVLLAFERAETATTQEERDRLMTLVVVGGGPTGVELAGAFAELARHVLKGDFQRIDPGKARVVLVEAGDRVLGHFPPELSESAERQLRSLGVEVRINSRVKEIRKHRLEFQDDAIFAENILWAAGVSASPLTGSLGVELDRAGRVKVRPDLSIPGFPSAFAIGDMALVLQENGKPVPGVSPAAMQMARHVSQLLEDELSGTRMERKPFQYFDKGTMATIGRSAAVADIRGVQFTGVFAWLAWLFVHLIFLIGLRNKLKVLLDWTYAYLTYKRGARIITGMDLKPPQKD